MDYKVLRHHIGDKFYKPGDIRTAEPNAVAKLVGKVLVETDLEQGVSVPLGTDTPPPREPEPVVEPEANGRKGRK